MEDWCHHILQGSNMITLPVKEIGTLTVNRMYLFLILIRKRTWFRPALIKGWEFEMLCSLVSSGIRGIDKVRFNVDSESQKSVSHNAAVKNSRTRKEISYCKSCEASFRQEEVDLMRTRTLTCTFSSELAFSFKTSSENSAW